MGFLWAVFSRRKLAFYDGPPPHRALDCLGPVLNLYICPATWFGPIWWNWQQSKWLICPTTALVPIKCWKMLTLEMKTIDWWWYWGNKGSRTGITISIYHNILEYNHIYKYIKGEHLSLGILMNQHSSRASYNM